MEGDLEEVVKLLLENGSDMEINNREGKTPLQLAHRRGDKRVMKAFIDAGVNLNLNLNLGAIATANTRMTDTRWEKARRAKILHELGSAK